MHYNLVRWSGGCLTALRPVKNQKDSFKWKIKNIDDTIYIYLQVRNDFRSTANAFAQAVMNILGYAMGTVAPGVFMNLLDGNETQRLRGGLTLLFCSSALLC